MRSRRVAGRRKLWSRRLGLAVGVVALSAGHSVGALAVTPCWTAPVDGTIVDPFRLPACSWCPGNRGIEYATSPGSKVRAVAAGTVTFSGAVAGVRYAVVTLANGWQVTYGHLASIEVTEGQAVVSGAVIATTTDSFHFGVRVGGEYVDPGPYIGQLHGWLRLLPTDGSPARPAPPPRTVCNR